MKEEVCEDNEEVHNTDKPAAVLGVWGAPSILHVPENNRKLRKYLLNIGLKMKQNHNLFYKYFNVDVL